MKVYIVYDQSGEITGTVTSTISGFSVGAEPGMRVHTIEMEEESPDNKIAQLYRLHTGRRVIAPSGTPELVPLNK